MNSAKGPSLYEFLTEAELQQYFNTLKNDLKIQNVGQIKFVTEDDLQAIGMSKPEIRRLKKYFHKYFPHTYLSKIKKILINKKDNLDIPDVVSSGESLERQNIRVPSKHIIPSDAVVINKELGVGEFGVVQQGIWTNEDGERIQVAIKCLSRERMQTHPMEFVKEAAIMHTINSEHIVRLYGVVLDTNSLMLVTELAPLRSLLECIKEPSLRTSFPVLSLCNFSVQICDGMSYLESHRLIHRDLAARNILVFSKNKIKISDFGLSRALGVGKDYYQTNFNVNLKLPIAWCAPECINYLRFTSASDVWAFGVTLWEMFSYGFQPWAALTGQQILEAIDEPNFQRLEQPDCCPKDYYALMLKCWQHDPLKRVHFSELLTMLPECKPEQVQMVQESDESALSVCCKRDRLQYAVGDIITVVDKKPLADYPGIWKGVHGCGKTGLFNPASTVAYLGQNVPSNKINFQRSERKNLYSSKRRLRTDMISGPQGDFKHTSHVGLDGAYFGDISFLAEKVKPGSFIHKGGDKYEMLPKQIVTPYKPSDDQESVNFLTRASSDVSDRAPLLRKVGDKGKSGPASDQCWFEEEAQQSQPVDDHEYHEISDDENETTKKEPCRNSFDLGPSLMDEVFKALGGSSCSASSDQSNPSSLSFPGLFSEDNEAHNVSNEIRELTSLISSKETNKKKAVVKPISAVDQRTLDSAIAMANELASKSMLEIDKAKDSDGGPESPTGPSKQAATRFSFKTHKSPKMEHRNFTEETASIPDIQSSITDGAKEIYDKYVDRPVLDSEFLLSRSVEEPSSEVNPLRMLRSGVTVRPKVRGNKHHSGQFSFFEHSDLRDLASPTESIHAANQTFPRGFRQNKRLNRSSNSSSGFSKSSIDGHSVLDSPPSLGDLDFGSAIDSSVASQLDALSVSTDSNASGVNPVPLPPRDRTKVTPQNKRHQRKYPLVIPGVGNALLRNSGSLENGSASEKSQVSTGRVSIQHTHNPLLETLPVGITDDTAAAVGAQRVTPSEKIPPAKPPRLFMSPSSIDDSFENQVASEIEALDDIDSDGGHQTGSPTYHDDSMPDETSGHSLYHFVDHVSCEDLLDFALDLPNTKRTRGPARGTQSDEVHIMQKVLKNEQMSPEECVVALNECDWDVHRALKLAKLQLTLTARRVTLETARATLSLFSWDIEKASSYLAATSSLAEDTALV